jgi:hypothetical protein
MTLEKDALLYAWRREKMSRKRNISIQRRVAKPNTYQFWRSLALFSIVSLLAACSPPSLENKMLGDIRPPIVRDAKLKNAGEFEIEFDETVCVGREAFSAEPKRVAVCAESSGEKVCISLLPQPFPGEKVILAGTVEDICGNSTHVQVQFKGYNDKPARIILTEVQTAKNTSKKAPHRDYIEFIVQKGGNLGGMFVQWASSAKIMKYDFMPCEVRADEVIVLHLAPEGILEEKDETGEDTALSGGIDANAKGRDFWSEAGGLPDSSGAISVYEREGSLPIDGLFYGESSKSGPLESSKLISIVQELSDARIWNSESPAKWENAFLWKPSASRPFIRTSLSQSGASAWKVGESGSQTPGSFSR